MQLRLDALADGFLSTPSARRATALCDLTVARAQYFYPRPPRGGRLLVAQCILNAAEFLSTPSARRATTMRPHSITSKEISIHALREEGDPVAPGERALHTISIHALREEGDRLPREPDLRHRDFYPRPPRGGRHWSAATKEVLVQFLSTPSARRATQVDRRQPGRLQISIHALREEGDRASSKSCRIVKNFYPRPPRGGRLAIRMIAAWSMLFLSTPSARRATLVLPDLQRQGSNFYPRPPRGGRRKILP